MKTETIVNHPNDRRPNGRLFLLAIFTASATALTCGLAHASDTNLYYDVNTYGATGNGVTNDGPDIQAALTAAGGVGKSGIVKLHGGIYLTGQTLLIPQGVTLEGAGGHDPSSQPGSSIEPYGGFSGALLGTSSSVFWHEGGIINLSVRHSGGDGIYIAGGMGEAAYIDRVTCDNNAGDGIHIAGDGTPVHLGHLSVHSNGAAGLDLDHQQYSLVQVLYVAGDNNGTALVYINGGDTTSNYEILGWKAERWGTGFGNPCVFLLNNLNGAMCNIGSGRINIGSGVNVAGTAIVHQTFTTGSSIGYITTFGVTETVASGSSDYAAGYLDDKNSLSIPTSVFLRHPFSTAQWLFANQFGDYPQVYSGGTWTNL